VYSALTGLRGDSRGLSTAVKSEDGPKNENASAEVHDEPAVEAAENPVADAPEMNLSGSILVLGAILGLHGGALSRLLSGGLGRLLGSLSSPLKPVKAEYTDDDF
jgi:hypothetical protein